MARAENTSVIADMLAEASSKEAICDMGIWLLASGFCTEPNKKLCSVLGSPVT